jgi:hypothetical protein
MMLAKIVSTTQRLGRGANLHFASDSFTTRSMIPWSSAPSCARLPV